LVRVSAERRRLAADFIARGDHAAHIVVDFVGFEILRGVHPRAGFETDHFQSSAG
jgi:hypothetical protein